MNRNFYFMTSPIGNLKLESDGKGITRVEICHNNPDMIANCGEPACPILKQAVIELTEYFSGERRDFTVPVSMHGTEFQIKVWESLKRIPYGETRSYGEIAADIGNPKAARAVGMANNRNQVIIFVPCHRVIGKDGSLVGFGCGLPVKEFLLKLESAAQIVQCNGQVDISGINEPD